MPRREHFLMLRGRQLFPPSGGGVSSLRGGGQLDPRGMLPKPSCRVGTGRRSVRLPSLDGPSQHLLLDCDAWGRYQTLTFGSHVYVIPLEAAGYLGAPLDLSLFDVAALAAGGYAAAPLALDITASSTSAALPGITMTAPGKARQEKGDAVHFGRALGADRRARKQGTAGAD